MKLDKVPSGLKEIQWKPKENRQRLYFNIL